MKDDLALRLDAGAGVDPRGLADALPLIVWTCDANGRIEWLNHEWTRVTGISSEDARAGSAREAVHPDDRARVFATWDAALAAGTPFEIEYRLRAASGAYRWHLGRGVPLRDREGRVLRWVATATDIETRKTHEEAVRALEHRFSVSFHANPQPTTITRLADGVYVDANEAFAKMTGYTREELVGHSVAELGIWMPGQREQLLGPILRGEPLRADDVPVRTKDGRIRHTFMSAERIELDGVPCILTVGTDTTEQRAVQQALRESEARARARAEEVAALLDAVPAAVWIADDPQALHVRGNRVGHELLRARSDVNLSKTGDDPEGVRHFDVLIDGARVPAERLPLQRAARDAIDLRNVEEQIRFNDGSVLELYGSAVPLRAEDGSPRGAIAAFVDVTRLKEAEAALRDANRRKDEFLAMLSHELRNPLAPIVTAVELMRMRGNSGFERELDVVERQARHLTQLVDDLLDVSRVARGKITLRKQSVELRRVVAKALEITGPLFEEKRHTLHIAVGGDDLVVDGDEVRLVQIVSNLLTNAARYTPASGNVWVHASAETDEAVLSVRDDGVGLAADLVPRVFELFVQGERRADRAEGGLGIGLALVRSLTVLHGGRVFAQSAGPGKGSEFVVRLPRARLDAVAPASSRSSPSPSPAATPPPLGARRILLVDDNADATEMLAIVLSGMGHEVCVAHDAASALARFDEFAPDVAVLDLGLPVMDGYDLGALLRKDRGYDRRLIALSGYGQDEDRARSRAAGFDAHLVKPVDIADLVALFEPAQKN